MDEQNLELSIAHLFPKYLNLFGDNANLSVIMQRCIWRGIDIKVTEINDFNIELCHNDFYFLAGGSNKMQKLVADWLVKNKEFFNNELLSGAVFLGVGGGFSLLGKEINKDGNSFESLGLLNVVTETSDKRMCGNVTSCTELFTPKFFVGFENHSDSIFVYSDTKPLASVCVGCGNNLTDKIEGAYYKTAFGTNLHGPVLPKNVHFADYLIKLALEKRYNREINLKPLDDTFEDKAREVLIGKSY